MAKDEAGSGKLLDFQKEVLTEFNDHLRHRKSDVVFEKTDDEIEARERELEEAALDWCRENDVDPEHLENSLARYSENFSPATGGRPLHITRAGD